MLSITVVLYLYDYGFQNQALDRSHDGNITVTSRMTRDVWLLGLDNCTDYRFVLLNDHSIGLSNWKAAEC